MKRIIALTLFAAAIFAAPGAVLAACTGGTFTTVPVFDKNSATVNMCASTDGSTATVPNNGILGGTNNANKLVVNADGSLLGQVTDGTNTATVKAASTSPATTDKGLVVSQSPNPAPVCASTLAINQSTSTPTDLILFTNSGYICSIVLVSAAAQNVSLVTGTGAGCTTTTALMGGTTASVALAANGGFSAVAGVPWLKTAAAAHLCLFQSTSSNVSGVITYTDHS